MVGSPIDRVALVARLTALISRILLAGCPLDQRNCIPLAAHFGRLYPFSADKLDVRQDFAFRRR